MFYTPPKEKIKHTRKALRLTQKECADMCFIQCNTWSRYEQGVATMSAPMWELFRLKAKELIESRGQI